MPKISIIIRTKNEEDWISHCLENVFNQDYKDFEVTFRSKAYNYYKKWIFRPIQQHRVKFLESQNQKRGTNRQVGKISSMGSNAIKSRDQEKLIHIPNPKLMSVLGN